MIINQKIKESLLFTNFQDTFIVFTNKADLVLKNSSSAVTIQGTDNPELYRTLMLNNNLTIVSKVPSLNAEAVINGIKFLSDKEHSGIISNDISKTTKISLTASPIGNAGVYGWNSAGGLTVYGSFMRQNFNISSTAKDAEGNARALAIYVSKDLNSNADFKGNFTVSANAGKYAYAYGIYTENGSITLKAITGKMTITAKLVSASGVSASAAAVEIICGDFTADRITGKITVSGDTSADGFYVGNNFSVGDMSKMRLTVTSKIGMARGIYCGGNGIIGKTVLDLGKISVSSPVSANGVCLEGNLVGTTGYSSNNRLFGNITATSKKGSAWGVDILDLTDTLFSATVKVIGKNFAYGVTTAADLTLDGAKITAKVLNGSGEAYSVYIPSTGNIPALENIITLAGKSVLTGTIDTGKYEDTVIIESGSKLTGGLKNVENLELVVNDVSQKKNALWYADTLTGTEVNTTVDLDYGLHGEFKLITKKAKDGWLNLINMDLLNYSVSDELFSYSVFLKGNDLYLKSELREEAAGNVFKSKINVAQTLDKIAALFTSNADVNVKDERIAVECGSCTKLVLDNNITSTYKTVNSYDLCAAVNSSADLHVAANNIKKTLKINNAVEFDAYHIYNNKTAETCGYNVTNALTLSHKFLQNITVSVTGKKAEINAYGIKAEILEGNADISGKFTVSGKADEELSVYGIYAVNAVAGNVSGTFNVTSSGMETSRTFGIYAAQSLILEKLSGTFKIKSTGIKVFGDESTISAAYADDTLTVNNGFTGKITVNVKNLQSADVYGIKAGENGNDKGTVALYGKNSGSISLTNTAVASNSETVGIFAKHSLKLTDYSGAITVKAVGRGSGNTFATAVAGEEYLDISGVFSSKLKISAENTSGIAYAHGIALNFGTSISVNDISGVWNISARGFKAGAFGVYSINGGAITLGNVSATMNITAKAQNIDSSMVSYAFHSANTFSAENISAKITVTSTGASYGFFSAGTFSVADMSQMKLNVTSQNAKAYGICTEMLSAYVDRDMIIAATGLNVGKITVKGKDKSYGISISGNIYTENNAVDNRLTGTIRVTSTSNAVYGIKADAFCDKEGKNAVVISADISVTGHGGYGIYFDEGDLTLDNAKIKAEKSGKNNFTVYAIYTSGSGDDDICIKNNSNITGHINTLGNSLVTNDTEEDFVRIESGSKLTGALCNVEYVQLILNGSAQAKNSLWDVTECDEMTRTRLWLDIEEGMTGNFLLAVNKTDSDWDDILDFSGNCENINLNIGAKTFSMTYGCCEYENRIYSIEEKGNKLFLAVAEK